MAETKNRCWPGYEPVKGKSEHEQGSCKPKADSKLSPGEKKFRSARRKQLDQWEAEHPNTRKSASQHLAAPGKKTKTAAKKTTVAKKTTAPKKKRAR